MRNPRADGFTLIEVLAALALLTALGGLLLAAQGMAGRLAGRAFETETALWLARARLVEAAAYPDRAPPEDERPDRYEGIDYVTRIEYRNVSALPALAVADLPAALRLVELRAQVTWGERGAVYLTTYRRLPAPAAEAGATDARPTETRPSGAKP